MKCFFTREIHVTKLMSFSHRFQTVIGFLNTRSFQTSANDYNYCVQFFYCVSLSHVSGHTQVYK